METNPYKSKNLLLLVSKILNNPRSNTFMERIFTLMSSHLTDTRNQCNVGLIKAKLLVKENFVCIQVYYYIKEQVCILNPEGSSEKYYLKREQKNILLSYRTERPMPKLFFN